MFWTPDGESYMPGLEFFSKKTLRDWRNQLYAMAKSEF
jgi:hypothetical protein